MKFNNELSLNEYVAVVNEIVSYYFDGDTHEYIPHIGELCRILVYFNHCVETDENDEIQSPASDLSVVEKLVKNERFINMYDKARWEDGYLNYADAESSAMNIVEHKKDGLVYVGNIIVSALREYGDILAGAIEDMDVDKVQKIAESIANNNITADSIVQAFQNSQRYNDIINGNAQKAEDTAKKADDTAIKKADVITMPKKDSGN